MKTGAKITLLIAINMSVIVGCERVYNPFDSICPPDVWTPDNFTVEQEGNAIILRWEQPISHISGFNINKKVGDGNWSNVTTLDKTSRTWTDNSLFGGQLHTYQINAYAGENESNEATGSATAQLLKPTAVSNEVIDISYNWAILEGEVNPYGLETTVSFQYKQTSASEWISVNANPEVLTGSSYQIVQAEAHDLIPNTEYHFKVVAENVAGKSESQDLMVFSTEEIILTLSTSEVIVSDAAGRLEIPLNTNIEDLEISSNVLWLSASISGNIILITYQANETVDERVAIITLTSGVLTKTVTITQRGGTP